MLSKNKGQTLHVTVNEYYASKSRSPKSQTTVTLKTVNSLVNQSKAMKCG